MTHLYDKHPKEMKKVEEKPFDLQPHIGGWIRFDN